MGSTSEDTNEPTDIYDWMLQKLEKATASTLKAFIVTEVYAQGRELSGLYHHPTTSEYRQDLLSAIGDVRSGTWRNTLEEVLHGWWDSEWPSEASLGESPDQIKNAIEVQCLELEKYEILRLQALIKQISDHEISQHDTFWTYDGNGSLSKYRRYAESIAPHEIRTIVDSAREGRRSQATRQSVQSMPGDSGHGNEHGPIRPPPR
ncbi:hypothetical protein M231_05412 [Tremella mesenterica]|uniref:Uncharacterized protein n=1 Tax=Tremella mesenterica TaxID=5217 RepID=A0A4Q1BI26_TREME|nr:hypothetical protein M231_05412 [Tremella mesenterica]